MGGGGGGGLGGIGGAVGGIVGGIIGDAKASGDRSQAQGYAEQAYNELIGIGMPPDLSKEIILQKFQEAGLLSPEVEKAIELRNSEVAGIQEAPETREAQMEALRSLQQLGKTGLGAEDRAALAEIRDQVQRDLEAKRQQVLQSAQARGMGGSGAELISQLQGSQASANLASEQGLNVAAQAQRRALESLGQSANLAGQVRSSDYQTQLNRAKALDEMNRFNVDQQVSQQSRNVAARNIAQQANLQQRQKVMDMNTAMSNNERMRQEEAKRQYWLDQMERAQQRATGFRGMSNEYNRRADRIADREQGMWSAAGSAIGSGAELAFGMPSLGGGSGSTGGYNPATADGGFMSSGGYKSKYLGTFAHGGMVPGEAPYKGDTEQNDIVNIDVSPGEIVIPKSVVEHEKAPEVAKKFVDLVLAMKNKKEG